MKLHRIAAAGVAAAMFALNVRATPAVANGTTNTLILVGGAAAATYLIVEHNRKVHEQEAQAAQRQAALEEQNDDAWAAYQQAEHAYQQELTVNSELQKEITYQHSVVTAQDKELSGLSIQESSGPNNVATVSYGWGKV